MDLQTVRLAPDLAALVRAGVAADHPMREVIRRWQRRLRPDNSLTVTADELSAAANFVFTMAQLEG